MASENIDNSIDAKALEQADELARGVERVISREELAQKIATADSQGRPLRVKLGVDPTTADLHLGHTVALAKLRQFQDFGHLAVLIIGDFTASIGDPSGRDASRPAVKREQILQNAETYAEQAFKILDAQKTETLWNGEWFLKMSYAEVLRLNSHATVQQMIQRDDFKKRLKAGREIRLHETQYPLAQAWDSVVTHADVELGGSDQLFNILVGRDLQSIEGQEPQVAMLLPLLEGTDGKEKMSKSLGNYIGVNESADSIFGKVMSISDELMQRYYKLLLLEECDRSLHPMEAKKNLATQLVERFHSSIAAKKARETFEARFSQKVDKIEAEKNWPTLRVQENEIPLIKVLHAAAELFPASKSQQNSNSDWARLGKQGALRLNDEKLPKIFDVLEFNDGDVLRMNRKESVILQKG